MPFFGTPRSAARKGASNPLALGLLHRLNYLARENERILQGNMEVYKSEVDEILHRFLGHRLRFPDCIAALDAALAGLIPNLTPEQLPELRAVMLANNARVMKEMEKRERVRKVNAKSRATAKNRPASN